MNKNYIYELKYVKIEKGKEVQIRQTSDNGEIAGNWFIELSNNQKIKNLRLERQVVIKEIKIKVKGD